METNPDFTNAEIKKELLRHIIATLAYRCNKVISNAPDEFSEFNAGNKTRTPGEILAHISDLIDWALRLAKGEKGGLNSTPLEWEKERIRFFATIKEFDNYLAGDNLLSQPSEKLFQGPIADAFTHIGQIGMLRRLAGNPVKGENYFKAEIITGNVGEEQSQIKFEFD